MKVDDFQRWIPRLVYRWRTLRNAIRNANCTTQWIIEILNAYCAAAVNAGACLVECHFQTSTNKGGKKRNLFFPSCFSEVIPNIYVWCCGIRRCESFFLLHRLLKCTWKTRYFGSLGTLSTQRLSSLFRGKRTKRREGKKRWFCPTRKNYPTFAHVVNTSWFSEDVWESFGT